MDRRIRGFLLGILMLAAVAASSQPLSISIEIFQHATCGQASGGAQVHVSGGTPPYEYLWSNGNTYDLFVSLYAGTYSVTVTDDAGVSVTQQFTIENHDYGFTGSYPTLSGCAVEPARVFFWGGFDADGTQYPHLPYGPGPYSFWYEGTVLPYAEVETTCISELRHAVELPDGVISGNITYEDGNGCPGWFQFTVPNPVVTFQPPQILELKHSCGGTPTGRVRFHVPTNLAGFQIGNEVAVRLKRGDGTVIMGDCGNPRYAGQTVVKDGLEPGIYWIVQENNIDERWSNPTCADSTSFEILDLGPDCAVVSGSVYVDSNGNCAMGSVGSEPRVPNAPIEIQPGPTYITTDATGSFNTVLGNGSYTLAVNHPALEQSCPITLEVDGQGDLSGTNVGMAPGASLDLQAQLSVGPARPGFQVKYELQWENLTSAPAGNITLSLTVDPVLTYVSSSLPAPVINGNTYTWTGNAVNLPSAFQMKEAHVRFLVPIDMELLGTVLVADLTVTPTNPDANETNNTATAERMITGSYDPNDKLARTSSGETEVWVNEVDQWIDYTIRFQNTGTDTAFNVIITDTLPATLDPRTISWGPKSHEAYVVMEGEGVLVYNFYNILLPDSNVNEPLSHGHVNYRIKPREGLTPGTLIENVANIYFDFNPPVITDPNVLEVVPPPVFLDVRAALGGAYDLAEGLMRDDLRGAGFLPGQEPYTALEYEHAGGGGGETVSPIRMGVTGDGAIVDWVVLELRDAANPATVLHSKSALLRRDGKVVATDGRSAVPIRAGEGNYYVALRHRNHLGVMTAAPVPLALAATTIDFTDASTATWGADARMEVGAVRALWPGDVTFDGRIKYTGLGNDRDRILQDLGGEVPTTVLDGYHGSDVNMDGTIQYTGQGNDRDLILQVVGSTVPTAVRAEQIP